MKFSCWLLLCTVLASTLAAADSTAPDDGGPKHTLRYRFQPGLTLRWEVEHRARTDTTISGDTQSADTLSKSVQAWRVVEVHEDGSAVFENIIQSVDMRQRMNDTAEVCYDSKTDAKAPPGFEDVARSVNVPLSVITINPLGKIVAREDKQKKASTENDGYMSVPLPEQPVAVGDDWSFEYDVFVELNKAGATKRVRTRQSFQLLDVKTGVATIRVSNQILTPIDDPKVESQLIQRQSSGTVRFDIDAGRVLSQQMEVDKRVVGFSGEASSVHYVTRFDERFLDATVGTAAERRPFFTDRQEAAERAGTAARKVNRRR